MENIKENEMIKQYETILELKEEEEKSINEVIINNNVNNEIIE